MKLKTLSISAAVLMLSSIGVSAQESKTPTEQRASLNQAATALDAAGAPALEATLRTTSLNGAVDAPVTNARMVIKNVSSSSLTYASGTVTFYDNSGIRCGEGLFKLDALAQGESADTDAPGLRVTCSPSSWRIVALNLVARSPEQTMLPSSTAGSNLVISIDGEEHPIQLGRPMVLTLGDKQKTITVRQAP